MSAARRLPPYGRELVAARRAGIVPNVHLMVGPRAWARAALRRPPNVLALSPGDSPTEFNWRCCAGLGITVQATEEPDSDRLALLVHCLIHAGAALVAAIYRDGSLIRVEYFRSEAIRHVA